MVMLSPCKIIQQSKVAHCVITNFVKSNLPQFIEKLRSVKCNTESYAECNAGKRKNYVKQT